MRLLNIWIAALCTFSVSFSFAQSKTITIGDGVWKLTQYSADIIKVSFKPDAYKINESISDAVILKPLNKITIPVKTEMNFITIGRDKKVEITAPVQRKVDGIDYSVFDISLKVDEKIYGGGERALPLNRRGYRFNLYNSPHYGYGEGAENLNYSVPFFTSSNGYGLFFDNVSKGYADIGKSNNNVFEAGFMSGELNVYIIFGKDYKEILSNYHKLTGTQPLPPRWAMGNLMSRFGYTSQKEADSIVAKMKSEGVPVDAIIFDLFWFGDSIQNTLGNLAWINKTKWPDPGKMIKDYKKQNINTILITEPFVVRSSLNYNNTLQYQAVDSTGKKPFMLTNFYFGKGGLLDVFKKDTREWFWSKYREQMKLGVEAWWGDLGEPETHPANMYHNLNDLGYKRLFKADEVHNMYGHVWTKMLFDQYAKEYPTKRLFSLNRSGFAGTQRYSIFPWTGDVSRSWSGLRAQLPVILGMSMSGVPYVHSDAGGFAGGAGDNELYVRWLQFAAFTPIFRPHGTALGEVDKKAFSFPSEVALIDEPYRTYAKAAIQLRYSLLPYNYTLTYNQAVKGEPLIAPLYYYYPNEAAACDVSDEFMWGENILVAPILEKDMNERDVYFPKGKWYSFNNATMAYYGSRTYEFGLRTEERIGMNNIPIFIKAGSFIPTLWNNKKPNTVSSKTDTLNIHYFCDSKPSTYTMYDDDGVSKNAIATRQFELITFKAQPDNNNLSFHITSNTGKYKGRPASRHIRLILHGKLSADKSGYVNGQKIELFDEVIETRIDTEQTYLIEFNFTGKPITIEIK
ncbi:TIM-barrel domain-containing protein [Ferruginibacter sp. SUN002]|uniref:TIM-barrel domain-containing protein n=1 Tax=Ferruginibacter sp. SUN002 TaxID=2937789 RepID=UPI003D36D65E